jgi:signal transduction histidine kinase
MLSGTRLALLVLVAGMGLSSFLAFQAFDAHRSARDAVERGVENLSLLVGDRVFVAVVGDWLTAMNRAFEPVTAVARDSPGEALPGPEVLSAENLVGQNCECSLAPSGGPSFRIDLTSGELTWAGEEEGEQGVGSLRERLQEAATLPTAEAFFRSPWGAVSTLLVDWHGETKAVPFLLVEGPDGGYAWAYGFVLPAEGFFTGSLNAMLDLAPRMVPRELQSTGELPILAEATLESGEGDLLLARAENPIPARMTPGPDTRVSSLRAGNALDQVRMRVSLHPEFIEWVSLGEARYARTWLYLVLLAANASLVVVAMTQLRREQEFVRRRTEFIAGFSHEARTPLATIRLYSQGLRFGRIPDGGARERALDIVDRESRRLVHMVSNFLNHGAGERDTLRLHLQPLEASAEISALAASMGPDLRERSARLEVEAAGPVWIRADRTALQQILRNLLGNALKYGPPRQTIRAGVERVEGRAGDASGFSRNGSSTAGHDAGRATLYVEDEGPGVPEDERKAVFEPFVRTPVGIRSGAGGSGLGLSVVRDLVRVQGGRVRVEDGRRGRGARFVVELPLAAPESGSEPGASVPEPGEPAPMSPVQETP